MRPRMADETRPAAAEPASLVANTSAMFVARVYALITLGALSVYAIRTFSVDAYGRYAIAFALITIFGLLSEMGISTVALRELSMNRGDERSIAGVALWAELITSGLAIGLMFPVALLLGYSHRILVVLALGAGVILFKAFSRSSRRASRLAACSYIQRRSGRSRRRLRLVSASPLSQLAPARQASLWR